ncbi:MAG: amidohydrolase family protein, partial [Dehalococcoidia bacterium]|nr:amidohydrolase family protein [Dehalococcoidia bacterium]
VDLTFRDVHIVAGAGTPAFAGDVAIDGDRIVAVGEAPAGTREVDGRGMVLAPGFVDTHSHDNGAFIRHPGMEFKLAQGVTSEISGNCGFSAAPNIPGKQILPGDIVGAGADWEDFDGYFAACEARRPAINNAMLVGHNRVRAMVIGVERRSPTADELALMRGCSGRSRGCFRTTCVGVECCRSKRRCGA